MKQNKNQIRIGDVLYEASFTYRKIIEWEIVDIFMEEYLSGAKPVFVVSEVNPEWSIRSVKFLSDILNWHDTIEEAEKDLKQKLDTCPMGRDI